MFSALGFNIQAMKTASFIQSTTHTWIQHVRLLQSHWIKRSFFSLFCFITAYACFSLWHLCRAKFLNNVHWFCITKCHTHCSLVEEVRELKHFFFSWSGLLKWNETPSAPAAKYIEIRLIKAITQSTCLLASIKVQMKKWPSVLLTACSLECQVKLENAVSQCLPTKGHFRRR